MTSQIIQNAAKNRTFGPGPGLRTQNNLVYGNSKLSPARTETKGLSTKQGLETLFRPVQLRQVRRKEGE